MYLHSCSTNNSRKVFAGPWDREHGLFFCNSNLGLSMLLQSHRLLAVSRKRRDLKDFLVTSPHTPSAQKRRKSQRDVDASTR